MFQSILHKSTKGQIGGLMAGASAELIENVTSVLQCRDSV